MSASSVLERLAVAGIALTPKDGGVIATPRSALTDELRDLIRANKPDIIKLLEGDYTTSDLTELEDVISKVAALEDWPTADLERAHASRLRMAPARVLRVLEAYRAAHKAAVDAKPNPAPARARIAVCELI